MPRVTIRTTAQATVTEEWTFDVTPAAYERLMADEATREDNKEGGTYTDEGIADEILGMTYDGATYVNVENVSVDGEHDREIIAVEAAEVSV